MTDIPGVDDRDFEPEPTVRDRILAVSWVGMIIFGLLIFMTPDVVLDGVEAPPSAEVTGCVIRFTPTGPVIHVNATHACTGATSVTVNDEGSLRIDQTNGGGRIAAVTVAVDETLAGRGVSCGASGGVGTTLVRCFDSTTGELIRADSPRLVGVLSNLWLTWVRVPSSAAT